MSVKKNRDRISHWYDWLEMTLVSAPPDTPLNQMRVRVHARWWHPVYWLILAHKALARR